jgi:hypothetical protein
MEVLERSLKATDVKPLTTAENGVIYLSNRLPVKDGIEDVSQDVNWKPEGQVSKALGLLSGPEVSNSAVQRVLDVLRPLLGMGCSGSGTRFHTWYNSSIDNLGAWCYAWCAITQSYATTFGGANNIFRDRAYVPFIVNDAVAGVMGSEWHRGTSGMRPGDLVIYDWERVFTNVWGNDHIGIVEYDLSNSTWTMLEGNAGGGRLVRVKRDATYITGYVRLNWAKADGVAYTPSTPAPAPTPKPTGLTAPSFPLPSGWYFGPKSGPAQSVSGYYSYRADLMRWQQRMKDRGWDITVDGFYGPNTNSVARAFQAEKGLSVDGLIGAATWRAAWEAPVT